MSGRCSHNKGRGCGSRRAHWRRGRRRRGRARSSKTHVHEEDELFYVLSGTMTFRCGERSFSVSDNGFVFLPRGIPHSYTIESEEVACWD